MILELFKQFFVFNIALAGFYIIGKILLNIISVNLLQPYTSIFFSLLTGLVTCVIVYSITKSNFHTVNLFFILLVFPIIITRRKQFKFNIFKIGFRLNKLLLFEIIFLSLFVILLLNFVFEPQNVQYDTIYYLKISEALNFYGQENTHHYNNIINDSYSVEPYHYFEMWLSALLMSCSDKFLSSFIIFRVVANGIIMLSVILGMLAIAERMQQTKITNKIKIVTFLLILFFIPNFLQIIPALNGINNFFYFSVLSNPFLRVNLRTYWLFLIPCVIFILNKNHKMFFLSILSLPVISITTAPAVYSTITLLLIGNLKFKYFEKNFNSYKTIIFLGINFLSLASFFILFKNNELETTYYGFSIDTIINYYRHSYKAVIGLIFNILLHVVILYLPFFTAILFLFKGYGNSFLKKNKLLLLFIATLLLSGVLTFQLLTFISNTYQFAFIGYVGMSLLLFVFLIYTIDLAELYDQYKIRKMVILLSITVYCLFCISSQMFSAAPVFNALNSSLKNTTYSKEYLENIDSFFQHEKRLIVGAYAADSIYYMNKTYAQRMTDVYFLPISYHIYSNFSYSYEFCLSKEKDICFNLQESEQSNSYLKSTFVSTLFYRFGKGRNGISDSYEIRRNDFIRKYKIRYFILTKYAVIDSLLDKSIEKIILDKNSGERFLILKR